MGGGRRRLKVLRRCPNPTNGKGAGACSTETSASAVGTGENAAAALAISVTVSKGNSSTTSVTRLSPDVTKSLTESMSSIGISDPNPGSSDGSAKTRAMKKQTAEAAQALILEKVNMSLQEMGIFRPKEMPKQGKCGYCEADATSFCVPCSKVFYCSRAHQVKHWKVHKKFCYPCEPLSEESSKALTLSGPMGEGPYMAATKDIKTLDVIMEEKPLMTGPGIPGDYPYEPLCLGCTKPAKDGKCSKCKWPMCSPQCEKNTLHAEYECPIFAKERVQHMLEPFQYELLRVLRCLLTKHKNPEAYEKLLTLFPATERRRQLDDSAEAVITACFFINQNCGLKEFDEEIIERMLGVLDIHTVVNGEHRSSFQIYSFPAHLVHSCSANVRLGEVETTSGQHILKVVAIRPIHRGEALSHRLIMNMQPTYERQRFLHHFYYFQCTCYCCMDGTERGVYFSAVTCKECKSSCSCKGYLIPDYPKRLDCNWSCLRCGHTVGAETMMKLYDEFDDKFIDFRFKLFSKSLDEKIELLRAKVKELQEVFHPSNYHIWRCKQMLLGILTQKIQTMQPGKSWAEINKLYMEIEDLAEAVTSSVEVLQPGLSLSRGRAVYDLITSLWSYIQWCVIYGICRKFRDHYDSNKFFGFADEIALIFKYESGASIKYILDDVIFMRNNLDCIMRRLKVQNKLPAPDPRADRRKETKKSVVH